LPVFLPHLQPEEGEDEVECYTPFQFMLQFMLQPLLVESGSTAAGAFVPALRKMCTYIKFTADRAVSGSADMAGCDGCERQASVCVTRSALVHSAESAMYCVPHILHAAVW
jgi:hypothetical protein